MRNGTLTAKDFQASALKRGPRGPQGPKGDCAPGAIPRVGYASRDPVTGLGTPVSVGATAVDVLGLDVPAGSNGYVSSSAVVAATGPSRLIANAQAVMLKFHRGNLTVAIAARQALSRASFGVALPCAACGCACAMLFACGRRRARHGRRRRRARRRGAPAGSRSERLIVLT